MECPVCKGQGSRNGAMCGACNGTGNVLNNPQVIVRLFLVAFFICLLFMAFCSVPIGVPAPL
jgi:phage shock protein PspC (stress-responsive transcriptional regulator)